MGTAGCLPQTGSCMGVGGLALLWGLVRAEGTLIMKVS